MFPIQAINYAFNRLGLGVSTLIGRLLSVLIASTEGSKRIQRDASKLAAQWVRARNGQSDQWTTQPGQDGREGLGSARPYGPRECQFAKGGARRDKPRWELRELGGLRASYAL